jgi:DNA-binding response OmpR family regulator
MPQPTILAVVDDFMFLSRLEQHVHALNYAFVSVDSDTALADALEDHPALVIVDLHVSGVDAQGAITAARGHGVPVLAFGRHTQPELLRAARDAGADRVVPRSQLVEELPALVAAIAS